MVTGFTLRLYLSRNHTVQEMQQFCLHYFLAMANHRVVSKAVLKENAVFQHCIKIIVIFFYAKKDLIHWQILPHFSVLPNSDFFGLHLANEFVKHWISHLHSACSIIIRVF